MQMSTRLYLFASFTRVFGPRLVTTVLNCPRPPISLKSIIQRFIQVESIHFHKINESCSIEFKWDVKLKLLVPWPYRSKVAVSKCNADQSQVTRTTAES